MSTQSAFTALSQGQVAALKEAIRQGVRLDAIESKKCLLTWALEYPDPAIASEMGCLLIHAGVPFAGSRHGGPKPIRLLFERRLLDVLVALSKRPGMERTNLSMVWDGTLAGLAAKYKWSEALRALDRCGIDVRLGQAQEQGVSAIARQAQTTAQIWLGRYWDVAPEHRDDWLTTAEWLIRKGPPDAFPNEDRAQEKLVDVMHLSQPRLAPERFDLLQRAWLQTPAWLNHRALLLSIRYRLLELHSQGLGVYWLREGIQALKALRDQGRVDLGDSVSGGVVGHVLSLCAQHAGNEPLFQECLPLIGWAFEHGAGLKEFECGSSTWAWVGGLRGPTVRWEMLEALVEQGIYPLDDVAVDLHEGRPAMLPLAHALAPFSPQLLGPLFQRWPSLCSRLDEKGGTFLHHACRPEGNEGKTVTLGPLIDLVGHEPGLLRHKDVNGETFLNVALANGGQENVLDLVSAALAVISQDVSHLGDRDRLGVTVRERLMAMPVTPGGEPVGVVLLKEELDQRWAQGQPTTRVRF